MQKRGRNGRAWSRCRHVFGVLVDTLGLCGGPRAGSWGHEGHPGGSPWGRPGVKFASSTIRSPCKVPLDHVQGIILQCFGHSGHLFWVILGILLDCFCYALYVWIDFRFMLTTQGYITRRSKLADISDHVVIFRLDACKNGHFFSRAFGRALILYLSLPLSPFLSLSLSLQAQ